jgi:hypothetical protein
MFWDGAATVLDKIISHWGGLYWVLCIVSLLILHPSKSDTRFDWDHNRFLCLQKHVFVPFFITTRFFRALKHVSMPFFANYKVSAPAKTCLFAFVVM